MRFLSCSLLCLLLPLCLHAQYDAYRFKREVQGIESGGWYRIPVPQDMFFRMRDDMNDLRLMQMGTDTVDTPFIIHSEGYSKNWSGVAVKEVASRTGAYVFRHEGNGHPNRIRVDVAQRNFDVEFSLEGSENRLVWNPVSSGVRMMGVVERNVSYVMNEAELPGSGYTFYRLVWDDPEVEVDGVALGRVAEDAGIYQPIGFRDWNVTTDTDKHQSVVVIDLPARVPVSKIRLDIGGADGEYIRTMDARYVRQTITENDGAQRYLWRDWDRKVLSSFEEPVFHFSEVRTDHIELILFDQDELPLAIQGIQVFGLAYELRAMCAGDAAYEVIYGSDNSRPSSTSRTRPPSNIRTASLGPEELIRPQDAEENTENSLFGEGKQTEENRTEWKGFLIGFLVALGGIFLLRFLIRRFRNRSTPHDGGGQEGNGGFS